MCVSLDLLVSLLYAADDTRTYYIDRTDGSIVVIEDVFDSDDPEEEAIQLIEGDPERFAAFPAPDLEYDQRLYAGFAAQLPEGEVRDEVVLASRHLHGRQLFAGVIADKPELRAPWEAFREKAYAETAQAWAVEHGIRLREENGG